MKKAILLIIKEVGINGLIAIKADYFRSTSGVSFYSYIKRYNNEFTVHSCIYCHLTMIKDFAQYN